MSTSPPAYTPLPSNEPADEKIEAGTRPLKPSLTRADSATPHSAHSSTARSTFRRALLLATSVLSLFVLAATSYALLISVMSGGCGVRRTARNAVSNLEKRSVAAEESPQFSTTTYTNGNTSTFVYTTRPIVNPGGFTIGTLTGYVIQTTSTSSSREGFTATTIPASLLSPKPTISSESSSLPASETLASPTITSLPEFTGEIGRVLHEHLPVYRRDLPEDSISSAAAPLAASSCAPGEEFSFSIGRDGATQTYVKTTRAIVNPAGFTIGTLNGEYVRYKPTPTASVVLREELKKRAE